MTAPGPSLPSPARSPWAFYALALAMLGVFLGLTCALLALGGR